MSWAAHEFENYFLQKHTNGRISFFAIVLGAQSPDLITKFFVYQADDPAQFHRGWPGVGFTHSLITGVVVAVAILAITKSRSWALGVLVGQWAHVLTDIADTAGVMPFFPFSTENVTISMWKHAAVEGRYGDGSAYYSSLGGVWDLFWMIVVLLFAYRALRKDYFLSTVVPADPKVWTFLNKKLKLNDAGMYLLYLGFFFYGLGRMIAWFLYARFQYHAPLHLMWGGPEWVPGADLSDASFVEVMIRTTLGGFLFAGFLYLCWIAFIKKLWLRGVDPPQVERGKGIHAIFGEDSVIKDATN